VKFAPVGAFDQVEELKKFVEEVITLSSILVPIHDCAEAVAAKPNAADRMARYFFMRFLWSRPRVD